MIVKKDNVELIIDEDDREKYQKQGFCTISDKGKGTEEVKELKDMTVPELKKLAEEQEIEGFSSLNKAELLKVLGG